MDVELSVETAALATALTEKDPKTALAPAKQALNSGAEARILRLLVLLAGFDTAWYWRRMSNAHAPTASSSREKAPKPMISAAFSSGTKAIASTPSNPSPSSTAPHFGRSTTTVVPVFAAHHTRRRV